MDDEDIDRVALALNLASAQEIFGWLTNEDYKDPVTSLDQLSEEEQAVWRNYARIAIIAYLNKGNPPVKR